MKYSPVVDMELVMSDFMNCVSTLKVIKEAASNVDATDLESIVDSIQVLLEYMELRLEELNRLTGEFSCISWAFKQSSADSDTVENAWEKYQAYVEHKDFQSNELTKAYDQIVSFLDHVPEADEKPLYRAIKNIGAVARKQGYIEGYSDVISKIVEGKADYE